MRFILERKLFRRNPFRIKDIELDAYSPTECIMRYNDGGVKDYVTKKEVFLYDKDMNKNSLSYMIEHQENIKGKIERNDACICGSGKKCCMKKYEEIKSIMQALSNRKSVNYEIPGAVISEMAIEVFSGGEKDLSNSDSKEILRQMEEMLRENKEGDRDI